MQGAQVFTQLLDVGFVGGDFGRALRLQQGPGLFVQFSGQGQQSLLSTAAFRLQALPLIGLRQAIPASIEQFRRTTEEAAVEQDLLEHEAQRAKAHAQTGHNPGTRSALQARRDYWRAQADWQALLSGAEVRQYHELGYLVPTFRLSAPLVDSFQRRISYLRLSVTDRCDLRCSYCMPERMTFLPKKEVLSLEELYDLATGFIARGEGDMTILETTMAVDAASFAPVSAMMQTWAAAFQLEYDGWECAVVTH